MTALVSQGLTLPPQSIRDAIVRVTDPSFPVSLSAPVRLALTFLLRRVEASDGTTEFWVKRMNFAEIVGKCDKTISNWLNELEASNLIVKEQSRTHWGAFRCLNVRLTDYAVELLGLTVEQAKLANRKKTSHVPSTFIQSKETVDASFAVPAEIRTTARQGELPQDLKCLETDLLTRPAVFRLMKLASLSGKRLSDIVAACGVNIEKARHPYAYIRSLIARDKDYAYIAKTKQDQTAQAEKAQGATCSHPLVWERLSGCRVAWKGMVVEVGAVNEPCRVYRTSADGQDSFAGYLAGAQLLSFIASHQ